MSAAALLGYGLPLLDGIGAAELEGLDLVHHERELGAWEVLFNQNDASRDVYFLLAGALLALFWTEDGREIVFSRFPERDYLGELAAIDGAARSLAVVARSPARVLQLQQSSFLVLIDRVPAVRERVLRDLAGRVRDLTRRNLELTTFTVGQRVASYLIRFALEAGKLGRGGVIEAAPTHAEIAATIGANREMVSRSMSLLARRGAIRAARRRIEIVDPKLLSEGL